MTLIRSVSGIRGISGEDLNPEQISRFAGIFGDYLKSGTVLGGRDTRLSGDIFTSIFSRTLNFKGLDVLFAGIVPTPTVLFLVRSMGLKGGFIITASHNPPEYNGIKFVNSKGRFLNASDYAKFVKHEKNPATAWGNGSCSTDLSLAERHIDAVLSGSLINRTKIKRSKIKVVFDGACGGGAIVIPALLEKLGVELITINTDTNGIFRRPLEPIPANLNELARTVKRHNAHIGLATDGDGDRIAIVTPERGAVSEEYTLALCVSYVMERISGKLTVVNQSTSRMLDIIGRENGFAVKRTAVGEANVVDGIIRNKVVIGGEGNGGVILPQLNLTRDALIASALLIQMLADKGNDLDLLIDKMPVLHMNKVKLPLQNKFSETALKKLFPGIEHTENDGLRFEFDNGFIHIRKSGTEPIIRIISEFEDKETADKMIEKVKKVI